MSSLSHLSSLGHHAGKLCFDQPILSSHSIGPKDAGGGHHLSLRPGPTLGLVISLAHTHPHYTLTCKPFSKKKKKKCERLTLAKLLLRCSVVCRTMSNNVVSGLADEAQIHTHWPIYRVSIAPDLHGRASITHSLIFISFFIYQITGKNVSSTHLKDITDIYTYYREPFAE